MTTLLPGRHPSPEVQRVNAVVNEYWDSPGEDGKPIRPTLAEAFGKFAKVPVHLRAAMVDYICWGIPTGDHLRAVIENDLRMAICHADEQSLAGLPATVAWWYNEAPSMCWGSNERRLRWIAAHARHWSKL